MKKFAKKLIKPVSISKITTDIEKNEREHYAKLFNFENIWSL